MRVEKKREQSIKKNGFLSFIKNLITRNSVQFFALAVFVLGFFWTGYSIKNNYWTQLYNWDYNSQYVSFYYDYHDIWHTFLRTGQFRLYDATVFLGSDAIGSDSYYGLFDPFVVFMVVFFPKSIIPQMTMIMTFVKVVVAALTMRLYLRYMGIKEGTARIGALAYAFSGYMNFMVGFPSFVSMTAWVPLILLGIEKVIRERKIPTLVWGLFLMGITSFFFLVVICIWGVIYAIWRYFVTIKSRNGLDNLGVILLGIASFAIGIMLSAWTLLPSIRESALSGRTVSVGRAYLDAIIASLKQFKPLDFFKLIFQRVGDNPGRELMGLVSFFYPTGGYKYLPLMQSGYDSWTSSLFVYTPFIILFFVALITSIREKRWHHLVAVALCLYLVFTNLAYFLFYAFSGSGYGRWFIVLIPEIILYGCWGFDRKRDTDKLNWPFLVSTGLALIGTISTYLVTLLVLKGKIFKYGDTGPSYFQSTYLTAMETSASMTLNRSWYLIYQPSLVLVEGLFMTFLGRKKFSWRIIFGFISVEVIIMGNMSFYYGSLWDYKSTYNGGTDNFLKAQDIIKAIQEYDNGFYRIDNDLSGGTKNFASAAGYNGTSTFHSLLNFDVESYAQMSHMAAVKGYITAYGQQIYNTGWSAFYKSKLAQQDRNLGIRYYIVKTDGYGKWQSMDNGLNVGYNVPFGYEYRPELSAKGTLVFENTLMPRLGYAVDSGLLYRLNATGVGYYNDFFTGKSTSIGPTGSAKTIEEWRRNNYVFSNGAVFEDDAKLPDFLNINENPISPYQSDMAMDVKTYYPDGASSYEGGNFVTTTYTTSSKDLFLPSSSGSSAGKGPHYFIEDYTGTVSTLSTVSVPRDTGKIVLTPKEGEYFNDDKDGCYIELYYPSSEKTRVYMFGDVYSNHGVKLAENQLLNFEYHAIADQISGWGSGNQGHSGLYGFYAKGKVKEIVFCSPRGSNNVTFPRSQVRLYVRNYSSIMDEINRNMADSLQNVRKKDENSFSFTTCYSGQRVVVTQIGYDAGWRLKAKVDGKWKSINTYKLDGGFVGFIAPEGDVSYYLSYRTPYLDEGIGVAVIGLMAYASIIISKKILDKRHRPLEKE